MRKTTALLALAAAAWAAPLAAQGSIRAGMTAADVRAAFGEPATTRETDGWTYLFYHNGCPRRCGSDDVVFLRDGRVVAAVLRTSRRRMEGPPASVALESIDPGPGERKLLVDRDDGADVLRVRQREETEGAARDRSYPGEPSLRYRTGGERMGGEGATVADVRVTQDTQSVVAPSMDEGRREREGAVNPRTITEGPPSSPVVAPASDPRQRERERAVTPRTVSPPRGGIPASGGIPADSTRPATTTPPR